MRGANWGPLGVRSALFDSQSSPKCNDLGDIRVIPHFHHDKYLNQKTIEKCRKALYGQENEQLPVSALSLTEHFCNHFFVHYPQAKLFSIGGDHSVSFPLVKSFLQTKKRRGKKSPSSILMPTLTFSLTASVWIFASAHGRPIFFPIWILQTLFTNLASDPLERKRVTGKKHLASGNFGRMRLKIKEWPILLMIRLKT